MAFHNSNLKNTILQDISHDVATRAALSEQYSRQRAISLELCEPLASEDYRMQTMSDVSPPWWNLGHTSWFFAKNILEPLTDYRFSSPGLEYVLNSYYEAHGQMVPRGERGIQSRPTTDEVLSFREEIDIRMLDLIKNISDEDYFELDFLVTIGIQHEQQHQELLITEIKHILGNNAPSLRKPYCKHPPHSVAQSAHPLAWVECQGGLHEFGNLEGGICWDNELPVHRAYVGPFALADRLVTVREYLEFIDDGGYQNPLLWLANGWAEIQQNKWEAPLYWERTNNKWNVWTMHGLLPINHDEPIAHVSFYEADAFANWKSAQCNHSELIRLPTELEWELIARQSSYSARGNFLDDRGFHPSPVVSKQGMRQLFGDLWEWTSSHYEPYPGYRPFDGKLMEYNGKFMDNQRVLRGGSCATPRDHIRASYRNFWPGNTRFQFTGIRLARSL